MYENCITGASECVEAMKVAAADDDREAFIYLLLRMYKNSGTAARILSLLELDGARPMCTCSAHSDYHEAACPVMLWRAVLGQGN